MVLVFMIMTLIFGIGVYLITIGSLLNLPIGITVMNIIFGAILILFSIGVIAAGVKDIE